MSDYEWRVFFDLYGKSGVNAAVTIEQLYRNFRDRLITEIYSASNCSPSIGLKGDVKWRESREGE